MNTPHPTLSEWRAPRDDGTPIEAAASLGELLSRSAKAWPDREAVVYSHQPAVPAVRWTYAELDAAATRLAASLLAVGYEPGDRVAILAPNHPEWLMLEYAFAKAGLVLVALNPLYKESEIEFTLTDSNARGLFYADEIGGIPLRDLVETVRRRTPDIRYTHPLSSVTSDLLASAPDTLVDVNVDPHSTFMIQYTSGTTGVPKAVRLSHHAIATTAKNSYKLWGLEGGRVCHGFPLFHVGGSGNSAPGAMLNGATTLPLYIYKPNIALDVLEKERCTAFLGVPTMVYGMLNDPSIKGRSFDAMKTFIIGGAPVPRDIIDRCADVFQADVINCYGQTETCGVTATTRISDSVDVKVRTSGAPLAGVSVAIKDTKGATVPHNHVGELHYKGPGRMTGYGSQPSPQDGAEEWMPSGDLAQMDAQGFVTIVGRKKEMIIRGGENLSPAEIENYMREHAAVRDIAVIGLPDHKYGEEVCAVVVRAPSDNTTADELRAWCANRISRWKVPRYIEFVDAFPLTASGKVRKFVLQERMFERLNLSEQGLTPPNASITERAPQ